MLIRDVENAIMPLHKAEKTVHVLLRPPDPKIEGLVASALAPSTYHEELSDAVFDFLGSCAQTITVYGKAAYEIVYLSAPTSDVIVGFQLVYIHPLSVMWRRGKLVQYVPADIARERNVMQFLELLPEEILLFIPPERIQSSLRGIIDRLQFLSNHIPGERFLFGRQDGDSQDIPYDIAEHIRAEKVAVADAAKAIGWNARGHFREEALEYYLVHRQLLFGRFIADLRNSIVATLNDGLVRAGRKIGFSAQIEIEGLPSLKDIDEALANLDAGEMSFRRALELVT